MTRLALLFLLILLDFSVVVITKAPESLAPAAIKAVIDKYFANNFREVQVINFGVQKGQAEEIIENCLKLRDQKITMRVRGDSPKSVNRGMFELGKPSVLLFDSPEIFNKTQNRIAFKIRNLYSHPHLVYIHNATIKDIEVVSNKGHMIDKTIFLVNETLHSIELATSFLFTPEACNKNQFKVINRFPRSRKRWDNSNFFVEKYRNFYGCPIELWKEYPILERHLNFTRKYLKGGPYLDKTISFAVEHLTLNKLERFNSYVTDMYPRKIYIPPGEVYGDYEKMLLPFDTSTWIAIVLTIGMSILTIVAIKMKPVKIQEIIFGDNNRSPFMNFISILLNGGQATNLSGSAPRMFLLTVIFWSLIFRLNSVRFPIEGLIEFPKLPELVINQSHSKIYNS
jgi:hypothetical protein